MDRQTEEAEAEAALTALANPEAFSWLEQIRALAALAGVDFGETISAERLRAWEQRHGCKLPFEYRLFLRVIGNGVFGHPYVALPPLAVDDSPSLKEETLALSTLFPLTTKWPNAGDTTFMPALFLDEKLCRR